MLPSRITRSPRGAATCRVTRRTTGCRAVVRLVAARAPRVSAVAEATRATRVWRREAGATLSRTPEMRPARRRGDRIVREARWASTARTRNADSGSIRADSGRFAPTADGVGDTAGRAALACSTGSRAGVTTASAMAPAVSARHADGRCSVASEIGPGHSRESQTTRHNVQPRPRRPSMDSNGNPDNSSFPATMPTHNPIPLGPNSHNRPHLIEERNAF